MFGNKTLNRLEQMLEEALEGDFQEKNYDETRLSRLETKWKNYLDTSILAREKITKEKENIKSLVSDMSHQIKTPMANLLLYISLLEELIQEENQMTRKEDSLRILGELTRQSEKLEFLMQSLTKMSRLESNMIEVRPVMQPIRRLLDETIEEIFAKAKQKNIEIVETYQGDGQAYYDLKWTKEALENILDNAIKYSPVGSHIILSVTEYEMYTAISVKDTGIGIREEELSKIFGRFYRSEEVNQEEGVGIGLYLSREILKRQNGYIRVKSVYTKGSEFILYLQRMHEILTVAHINKNEQTRKITG